MNMDLDNDGKISKWEYFFPIGLIDLEFFLRISSSTYIYMFYNVTMWFMALEDPNNAQAGLVLVVGAGAAWFGLYVNSKSGNVEIPTKQRTQPTL